jgi:hypothetical protein
MEQPSKPQHPTLTIKAEDEIAKGRFANLAQVGSNVDSFIMDFVFAQGVTGWLISRIILSPMHAKRFHAALGETIANHEKLHGRIEIGPTIQ